MKAAFPKTIKVGSASVKVFEVRSKTTTVYSADWRSEGKRRRKAFKDPAKALKFAKEEADALNQGRLTCGDFSSKDRDTLLHARRLLEPLNTPLERAVTEYATAIQGLGKTSLSEAVSFYLQHGKRQSEGIEIRKAVEEFLETLRSEDKSEVYQHALRVRLSRFGQDFKGNISSLTGSTVEGWLGKLESKAPNESDVSRPVSPRTRRNYFDAIRALISFCKRRGYLHKSFDELSAVSLAKVIRAEPQPLTPTEMETLLRVANPNFRAYLAIRGFAGVRDAEVCRMTWDMIKADHIRLPSHITKTSTGRLIPIQDNLRSWLGQDQEDRARICTLGNTSSTILRLAKKVGIKWRHNCLRDAYISYRVAITKNVAQTALEAGNTPQMINQSYLQLKTEAEAKEWFGIGPVDASQKHSCISQSPNGTRL